MACLPRSSYDVVSRTQLVVLGLRDSGLGVDEAAPDRAGGWPAVRAGCASEWAGSRPRAPRAGDAAESIASIPDMMVEDCSAVGATGGE